MWGAGWGAGEFPQTTQNTDKICLNFSLVYNLTKREDNENKQSCEPSERQRKLPFNAKPYSTPVK